MKKVFIAFMLMFAVIGVNAQTAVQTPKTFDNVYVGAQVGVTTPMSFNSVFPLNFNAGIKVGKNLTPIVGFNIEDNVWFGSATNDQGRFSYRNAVRANNLGFNVTLDMFNWVSGYRADRVFTIVPEVGLGWLHTFNSNAKDGDDLTAKTGIQIAWSNERAWQLYVEPTIWWNLTGRQGVQFNKNYSQIGLQVGFIYKFKNSNGTHNFVTWNVGAMNEEINNLRSELAKKPKVVEKVVEKTIVKEVVKRDGYVAFAQNSSVINDYSYLNSIPANSIVNVYGYASPEGDSDYNKILSEKRAQEVANYLIKRNVKVNKIEGYGANSDYSNRVVIIVNQ